LVVFHICSDIRGNNLTGTIPEGIGNCTSFEILYVGSGDSVGALVLPSLVGCYDANFSLYLACRDISYNQISGEIPYNIGYLQVATL
jgi:LRR receptor-like serine/threonine-protein kinase ERECTA